MKLVFHRNESEEIELQLGVGTVTKDFSYVELIQGILNGDTLEESIYDTTITDEEKERIGEMVKAVNDTIEEVLAEEKPADNNDS